MRIFLLLVLGLTILALVNMGMMQVVEFLDFTVDGPYFWGLNIVFSVVLLLYFVKLLEDVEEASRRDLLAEHDLGETKQDIKDDDDDDLDEDTSTDFPMFTDEDTPREYKFGTIDLVFRGATGAEAAIMAIQFISNDIFEEAKPAHRGPSSFGRPLNEAAVRVIYRRLNDSDLASSDAQDQRETIEAAFEAMRLKLPDGRVWEITDNNHIIWLPYNKFMYDMTILLDPVAGEPRKYHP